jgi:hypothetical protein
MENQDSVSPVLTCPTCAEELVASESGTFQCREAHQYTVLGLALTTNIAALRALWMAIRALEDDAASLTYMATNYGDQFGLPADARRAEADAALQAARMLREHAQRAQKRLDALPVPPLAVSEDASRPASGA